MVVVVVAVLLWLKEDGDLRSIPTMVPQRTPAVKMTGLNEFSFFG
jgi:hypothetical protein